MQKFIEREITSQAFSLLSSIEYKIGKLLFWYNSFTVNQQYNGIEKSTCKVSEKYLKFSYPFNSNVRLSHKILLKMYSDLIFMALEASLQDLIQYQ